MASVWHRLEEIHERPVEWDAMVRDGWRSLDSAETLPAGPLWQSLERRYAEHPIRFAEWHPRMADLLREARELECHHRAAVVGCSPPLVTTGCVPEPSAWLLMALGVTWLARRVMG